MDCPEALKAIQAGKDADPQTYRTAWQHAAAGVGCPDETVCPARGYILKDRTRQLIEELIERLRKR